MRSGFSLIELVVALAIFQVGLLATAGMVVLAQRNLLRAQITVRGVLAAEWVADSLEGVKDPGEGRISHPWGEVSWVPANDEIGGAVVAVYSPLLGDTLVRLRAVEDRRGEPDRSVGPFPSRGRP